MEGLKAEDRRFHVPATAAVRVEVSFLFWPLIDQMRVDEDNVRQLLGIQRQGEFGD